MTREDTLILTCSSLTDHVRAAQKAMGTDFPIVELDRDLHKEPKLMRDGIIETLEQIPGTVTTVLAAMAYCGGSWKDVRVPVRTVIPDTDDCISLLLHTDDRQHANLKQTGHMYCRDSDTGIYSIKGMYDALCREYGTEPGTAMFGLWFEHYTNLDIIDTGVYDCYDEAFVEEAQENADLIRCVLDYAQGSNRVLEKLVSGRWDEQFVVAEAGESVTEKRFHMGELVY